MNIGIVGSRSFTDYKLLEETLSKLNTSITSIVSGGAKGADSLARQYALANNIPLIEFLPDWNKHGKAAGFIRNKLIWENSDTVVAFWDGQSKGTKHTLDHYKGPIILVNYTSKDCP